MQYMITLNSTMPNMSSDALFRHLPLYSAAFQHISNRGYSPLQQHQHHTNTLSNVHVVHRFPEISSFLMLQHHGHTLDFRPGPRIPYQPCLSQPVPLEHLDNMNNVVPTCQLINALPCHAISGTQYPTVSCQSCAVQPHNHPLMTQSANATATVTSSSQLHHHESTRAPFTQMNLPHSPPPPTRKILATRKRKGSTSENESVLDSKYPKKNAVGKIEFRPLLTPSSRRHVKMSRPNISNRSFPNMQSSRDVSTISPTEMTTLGTAHGMPYKFEFNIPFPERPKEKTPMKLSSASVFKKPRNEISEKYQKTWPTEPVPKQGYISVLEQAINQLSERCMEDAKEADPTDSNKENIEKTNTADEISGAAVTKESLDKAWLEVLDKVFGKSDEHQQSGSRNYSSCGTSAYPSEYYSEVDWTTSTLESDYVSGAEQENLKVSSGTESEELKDLLPQNFQLPPEIRQTSNESSPQDNILLCTETQSDRGLANAAGDHDYSKPESAQSDVSKYQYEHDRNDRNFEGSMAEGFVAFKNLGEEKQSNRRQDTNLNEEDEDDYSDEEDDDVRDEQEEEKATDADVETEFMSSAEHEPPKWTFLKPRLLKRSSPKKAAKAFKREIAESDTSSGKEGFVTPTYQCNFPTSSDSETALGNCTPSQARKPQPPFKSPEPVDPTFRGVTVRIRTKVEKDQVQLSIKGFFK